MSKVKLKYLSPAFCQIEMGSIPLMKDSLRYKSYWFKRNRWGGGETKESIAYFMDRRRGLFLCGFLPRVIRYCQSKGIEIDIPEEKHLLPHFENPSLPEIEFRPYQIDLIQKTVKRQRGVIVSPTGSGKTIIALGIMSLFPKERILFLCHSISILKQTYNQLEKLGFKDIGFVGEGKKNLSARIIVASIKSMYSLPVESYQDLFDITIIDECFAKGTLILTDKGNKPIEQIKIGDVVRSKTKWGKVKNLYKNRVKLKNICKVKLSNGKEIYCSKNHLFFVNNNWIKARNLNKNTPLTYYY